MRFLDTTHKKKSAIITFFIGTFILLILFLIGMTYYDPPIVYGMEVSFGNTPENISENFSKNKKKEVSNISKPIPKKEMKNLNQENKLLNEKESNVKINKTDLVDSSFVKSDNKVDEEILKEEKLPEISESTKNVIDNLIKNQSKAKDVLSKNNQQEFSTKGNIDGSLYSSTYYSISGRERNFGLNGRNLKSSGKVTQECNQEGIVVVRITVNRNGKVIDADPGVKGTTNTNPCLLKPALKTALLHEWYPDKNAPERQVGFVVINFKLGE